MHNSLLLRLYCAWLGSVPLASVIVVKQAKLEYFGLSECERLNIVGVLYGQSTNAKLPTIVLLSQEEAVFPGSKQVNSQNGTGCYSSRMIEVIATESIQSNNDILKI